ncbi:hypothetical protein ACFE04_020202 [Oxalis oulophora]
MLNDDDHFGCRSNSSEGLQRISPAKPRIARQIKPSGLDSDSLSSSPASKMPNNRSPKVVERKKPASPASEKKRPIKVSELESQLAQLQEDLRKTKEQLNSSESSKKRALQEADDVRNQLSAMSAKYQESQQHLHEISACEDSRIHELRKISQDRDRAWQSELEAMQKHAESGRAEIESLKDELSRTFSMIENFKTELANCKESEARALDSVSNIRMQLETANETAEILRADGVKSTSSLSLELQHSNSRVKSLEGLISKLREDLVNGTCQKLSDTSYNTELARKNGKSKEMDELNLAKLEISQLKSALDEAEMRYQEEYIQSTMKIRSAYEEVERTKSEWLNKDAESETELKSAKDLIKELRTTLIDKENNQSREIDSVHREETKKLEAELTQLKASLSEKERELLAVTERNEELKTEIEKQETEISKANKNAELEVELRKIKVQSDQWRKAAEAATAILSTDDNNEKFFEKNYNTLSAHMGSPFSDDQDDDDSPKKRNGNVLKKIGVLWKKGQK